VFAGSLWLYVGSKKGLSRLSLESGFVEVLLSNNNTVADLLVDQKNGYQKLTLGISLEQELTLSCADTLYYVGTSSKQISRLDPIVNGTSQPFFETSPDSSLQAMALDLSKQKIYFSVLGIKPAFRPALASLISNSFVSEENSIKRADLTGENLEIFSTTKCLPLCFLRIIHKRTNINFFQIKGAWTFCRRNKPAFIRRL